jgi:hypothetical protein
MHGYTHCIVCIYCCYLYIYYMHTAWCAPLQATCAPLVRRTTSGSHCSLPFTWRGVPRDDCVWHAGMAVCPVMMAAGRGDKPGAQQQQQQQQSVTLPDGSAVSDAGRMHGTDMTAGTATNATGMLRSNSSSSSSLDQELLDAPHGRPSWRWEQCAPDYITSWQLPLRPSAPQSGGWDPAGRGSDMAYGMDDSAAGGSSGMQPLITSAAARRGSPR